MTQTPPDTPGSGTQNSPSRGEGPRTSGEQMRDLGRLRRSITDRKVAGVAGGLGRHLDVDPTILRVLFVVLIFFGGAGLVLYGAAWLLVPEEGQDEGAISTSPGTRNVVLIVAGVVAALLLIGDGWGGGFGFPWPLLILGLVALLFITRRDRPSPQSPAYGPPAPPGEIGAPAPTQDPATTGTQWSYQPPPQSWQPPPTPKRDRGPSLWWPTVALGALALGTLGLYDVAGGSVVDSAYPALALAVIGGMLVLSAWVGRARGLVFLGVLAAIVLAISSIAPRLDVGEIERQPATAAELDDSYSVGGGRIALDLTEIDDLENLDGRRVDIDASVGEVVVTVPDGLDVDLRAEVSGGGEIEVLGRTEDGEDLVTNRIIDGGVGAPELELDVDMTFGRVEVRQS